MLRRVSIDMTYQNNTSPYQVSPEIQQLFQQQQQMLQQQHQELVKDIDGVVDAGKSTYGVRAFDEAAQTVADALGQKSGALMVVLRDFDHPEAVIMHLAGNERRLKELAKLPAARIGVEVARIEAQLNSFGHVQTGSEPAWKRLAAQKGRISEEDWRLNGGDSMKNDAEWSRQFDKRMAERNKHRMR